MFSTGSLLNTQLKSSFQIHWSSSLICKNAIHYLSGSYKFFLIQFLTILLQSISLDTVIYGNGRVIVTFGNSTLFLNINIKIIHTREKFKTKKSLLNKSISQTSDLKISESVKSPLRVTLQKNKAWKGFVPDVIVTSKNGKVLKSWISNIDFKFLCLDFM